MIQETIQLNKKYDYNGYVLIFVNKWIQEHRFNVEQFIGRKLKNTEKVHHIDFCKENNEIENLVIFPDNKSHSHFHRQVKQFGMTRTKIREIEQLKGDMRKEREKNFGVKK